MILLWLSVFLRLLKDDIAVLVQGWWRRA